MASRGGFLVSDGALRRKNTTKKQHTTGSKTHKAMTRKTRKPEWDSTVNDLKVHKATEEELRKRHEAHKSKNLGIPTRKKSGKENESLLLNTPETVMFRKQAILQEILYGEDKFQEVLAETDRTMSAVKDLFGDDPKKFLGFPNVTAAPNKTDETSSRIMTGPFADAPETPTHLSILSDSVMRTPALNEVSDDSYISDSSPDTATDTTKFEPKLDLQRYRQFISHEAANGKQLDMIPERMQGNVDNTSSGMVHESDASKKDAMPGQVMMNDNMLNVQSDSTLHVPGQSQATPTSANQIPTNNSHIDRPPDHVNGHMSKKPKATTKPKSVDTSTSSNNGLKSLDDLKKMVESLEDEIAEYEMDTGRQPTATSLQTSSFSGYTSSLIAAVTKLMKYLKETEVQRKAEAVIREQIIQGFAEQRTLIDALTNDILQTQQENVALQSEFQIYRHHTDRQLGYLQIELQTVLKSFEYHTVQTTIDTLKSTKPVPLPQIHNNNQHMDHQSRGEYIPVTTIPDGSTQFSSDPPDSNGVGQYPAVSSEQYSNDMEWHGQEVTSVQSAFTNPVISNGHYSSNSHIHINQSQLHHEDDNFAVRQPVQKHLTVPGHSELRTQQTNVLTTTAVKSSFANTGLNSHARNLQNDFARNGLDSEGSVGNFDARFGVNSHASSNWQAHQIDSERNGLDNQGNRSNSDARCGLNSHDAGPPQTQSNDLISNSQNDQDFNRNLDQRFQKALNDNNPITDQSFGNLDPRQNHLSGGPINQPLHTTRNEHFRGGQSNKPALHSARNEHFNEDQIGQPFHGYTRQEYFSRVSLDNYQATVASAMPLHNAGHAGHTMQSSGAQQSHISIGQRNSDLIYPGLSSVAPQHVLSKSIELEQPYSKVHTTNANAFPKVSSATGTTPNENMTNVQASNLLRYNTHTDYMPMTSQSSMMMNNEPIPSHNPLQDRNGQTSSHVEREALEGRVNSGLQDINEEVKEDSLLVKSLSKDPLATMKLRNRLEGIATKQKNNAALKAATNTRTKHAKGHPSPHVHFKSPLEEPNTQGLRHDYVSSIPEKSPSVSPIPDDVPSVEMVVPRKGRQVVVNLPSIWSDVSSTVSL